MRALGRILVVLFVVLPALFLAQRVWNALYWDELAAVLSGRIETASPSTAYSTLDDQWLAFTLSGKGDALRVRSNAVLDGRTEYEDGAEWWYAFEYQLLDDRGEVFREGVYHHRTRLTRFRDQQSGREVSRNFLLDPSLRPTDGRSMLVHFVAGQRPAAVRLRPKHSPLPLQALMFRLYEKIPTPEKQLAYKWQRLAESKKARLARGSVYGLDLLREQEKQNLLRHEWKAVGPLGVEEEQYRTTKMYIARELEGEIIETGQRPFGLNCDAGVRGMIPLPAGDWVVSLDIVDAPHGKVTPGDLWVRWYGRGIAQRWQTRLPATIGRHELGRRFDGGQLEIVAPAPLVVRAWGGDGDERRELTPQPLRLRAYTVDAAAALTVGVDHVAGRTTPFRVDVRSRLRAGEQPSLQNLDFELLDPAGRRIRSGRLPVELSSSSYDSLSNEEPGTSLSEPVRYYFDLAEPVAAVRFSATNELLLTTYTRPPGLVRKVRIPEDYQDASDDLDRQPAWFLLRPTDEERLRREFRTVVLTIQPRPPETDPRLLAGDYDWTPYQPVGRWRARHLLVPRKEELPLRDHGLNAVYRELSAGRPMQVSFRGLPGRREVAPSLLYLRERASPLDVKVRLGDSLHSATQIAGRQGELRLPSVMPGSEQLVISSSEVVRWFINQADAQAPAYLRRLAMQLTDQGLTFEYLKESHEAEVLSGELYLASSARTGLRVTIDGAMRRSQAALREWTFRERLFDLQPQGTEPIPVLNSAEQPLAGGQRFFLPLGADLPPGRYRISFALQGASEAYLTLYRLTAGQKESRSFFREPADVHKTGI